MSYRKKLLLSEKQLIESELSVQESPYKNTGAGIKRPSTE
jgi:hypothetical protein